MAHQEDYYGLVAVLVGDAAKISPSGQEWSQAVHQIGSGQENHIKLQPQGHRQYITTQSIWHYGVIWATQNRLKMPLIAKER